MGNTTSQGADGLELMGLKKLGSQGLSFRYILENNQHPCRFALVIVILLIGVLTDQLIRLINRQLFRWAN